MGNNKSKPKQKSKEKDLTDPNVALGRGEQYKEMIDNIVEESRKDAINKFLGKPVGKEYEKLLTGDEETFWWLWDADNRKWIVAEKEDYNSETHVVHLHVCVGTCGDYYVPIYRLFKNKPTEQEIAKRKDMINIVGGIIQDLDLGVQPTLKF
tara:strand:- start:2067 stop:2522 length:456 start_codon:yes stop_codon:yes gene_type:complete